MLVWLLFNHLVAGKRFSTSHSRVEFSGVRKNVQLPVYYLYVFLYDESGEALTASPDNKLVLTLTLAGGSRPRAAQELIDRADGSFIARFRLWESVSELTVSLTDSDSRHLRNSPYKVDRLNVDSCHCPVEANLFKQSAQCSQPNQIELDFAKFSPRSFARNNEIVKFRVYRR